MPLLFIYLYLYLFIGKGTAHLGGGRGAFVGGRGWGPPTLEINILAFEIYLLCF